MFHSITEPADMIHRMLNRSFPMVPRILRMAIVATAAVTVVGACSLSDIVGDPSSDSENTVSPDAVKTPEGALAFYRGVVQLQALAFGTSVQVTGLLTDELSDVGHAEGDPVDYRGLPATGASDADGLYIRLQAVRANARQARGILPAYAPALPPSHVGNLYAIEGMADVMLADVFCSGIPLSTVDYGGDFTPRPGSSTADVYRAAIALFDSAVAASGDSARIRDFARVGKGRALNALGEFAAAASAVHDVPTEYAYYVEYQYPQSGNIFRRDAASGRYDATFVVSDREGGIGLPYGSESDPRTATARGPDISNARIPLYVTEKYDSTGSAPIVLASGIEARLIEAEAALRAGSSSWLTILNTLRTSSGLVGLDTLHDLGSDSARVTLLFTERAHWLFLTGHRQSDLRRLVRPVSAGGFGRPQQTVYPSGLYMGGATGAAITPPNIYGTDVNAPVPSSEQERNPLYHGCINRQA